MNYALKAQVVQDLLIRKGLNQAKLAKQLDISREAVSKWLSGESNPTPDKLLRLGMVLESSFDELMQTTPDPALPVVYFRRKAGRKTKDEHLDQAKRRGALLKKLAPLLPDARITRPPTLINPRPNYAYVQAVADTLRTELNIEGRKRIDFQNLIKKFTQLNAIIIPVLWGEQHEHGNALNVYLPDSLTTWVFLNLDTNAANFNFWMAHELGHSLAPDLRDNEGEDFADAFAQALLFSRQEASALKGRLDQLSAPIARTSAIMAEAKARLIHPLTIRKALQAFEANEGLAPTPLSDMASFMGAAHQFGKGFKTISEALLGRTTPEPATYLSKCSAYFHTDFFTALTRYAREHEDAESFIHELLGLPLADAKALAGELKK